MARPEIVRRVGDHAGANGIEFNVPATVQQVLVAVDKAGLVSSFPQGPQRSNNPVCNIMLVTIEMSFNLLADLQQSMLRLY